MKKKIALIQMDTAMGDPDKNYAHAGKCMEKAMKDSPDILVLPETVMWDSFRKISGNWQIRKGKNTGSVRRICGRPTM